MPARVVDVWDSDKTKHPVCHVLHRRWQRFGIRRRGEYADQGDRHGGRQPA